MKVDPYVNFAVYDNLNGNLPGTDGIVDFIYIIYRNASDRLMNYTGKALLNVSATLYVDGKRIINNTDIGGGVQQQGGIMDVIILYMLLHMSWDIISLDRDILILFQILP